MTTSAQAKDYLLCLECEERFNKGGETWIMANCLQSDRTFPLRENLLATNPIMNDGRGFQVFSAVNSPNVDREKIVYFALSVFWRAAAHQWTIWGRTLSISLGPYENSLRDFLLGGMSFPGNVALIVRVSTMLKMQAFATFPQTANKGGFHIHNFVMLGMEFFLAIGKVVPPPYEVLCHASSMLGCIVLSKKLDDQMLSSLIPIVRRHPDPRR